jgi:hypothetical protein
MSDISHLGTVILLTASNTFPTGFTLSAFADDTDPFDLPELTIGEAAMGTNGDLVTWSTANPIEFSVAVVPNSADHINLATVFEANRAGKNKPSARDVITITRRMPDGSRTTLTGGKIMSGPPAVSGASSGRIKTPVYTFSFENVVPKNATL